MPQGTTPDGNQKTPKSGFAEGIIFGAVLFLSVLLGFYSFSLTGIKIKMLLTINTLPLLSAVLSLYFVLFIILASLSIACILAIGKKMPFSKALSLIIPSYLAGAIAGGLLFNLQEWIIPAALLVIGIPFGIKYLGEKEQELHYLKKARSGASAAGRIITIAAILFALFLVANTYMQKNELKEQFIPELLSMTVGENNLKLSDSFSTQLAQSVATSQNSALNAIQKTSPYINLIEKNDPDAISLDATIQATKISITSPENVQRIKQSLQNQNIDIGNELIKKFNSIAVMAELAWLIYPLMSMIMTLFAGGFIVRNISALIYAGLEAGIGEDTIQQKANTE